MFAHFYELTYVYVKYKCWNQRNPYSNKQKNITKKIYQGLQASGRHFSARLIHIHEHSATTYPCVMTQHDNCGSRLLQPLVSVTKIGTQVSCHSKSLFFRSLSIKQSRPHAKMPRGKEREPGQNSRDCFLNWSRSDKASVITSIYLYVSISIFLYKYVYKGGGQEKSRRFRGRGGLCWSEGPEL